MAPAQVPKVGVVSTKDWRASKKPSRSRNLRKVVDSPPGMMRPSRSGEFGGVRTSFAVDAEGGERFGVGFVCALEGEDADGERFVAGCTPLPLDFVQSLHNGNFRSGPVVSDRHFRLRKDGPCFLDPLILIIGFVKRQA